MHPYDFTPSDFADLPAGLAAAHDYRKDLAGDRRRPAWRDFDLMAVQPPYIPYTNVADVIDGGVDFRFLFFGTSLTEIFGQELTGKRLSEVVPRELGEAVAANMLRMLKVREPFVVSGLINPRHTVQLHTLVRMPLSDDGAAITHIVTVSHYIMGIRDSRDMVEKALAAEGG